MSFVLAGKSCRKITVTTINQLKSKETKVTCGAHINANATTNMLVINFYKKANLYIPPFGSVSLKDLQLDSGQPTNNCGQQFKG